MRLYFLFFVLIFTLSCNKKKNKIISINSDSTYLKKNNKLTSLKNWHFKDIEIDTVPGISLNRAYDSLVLNKINKKIIVAVIDNEIDLSHKDLKYKIWLNKSEIPKNKIDDDNNGYIDDIHGWNFLGNKAGENHKFVNFEYTRILKILKPKYDSIPFENIKPKDSLEYKLFLKVSKRHQKRLKYDVAEKKYYDRLYEYYFRAKEELAPFFKNNKFTVRALDSLKKLKSNIVDEIHFLILIDCIKNDIDDAYVINEKYQANERINKLLNLDYNDRLIQGDNPNDINDTKYGNNILDGNVKFLNHGTKMAGIILNTALKDEIKIMPLAISAYGDEHDKDIALAIRYAVNNGANIINMSFGKEFSLHKEWVFDAIKYAEKNNVLIVSSAGNFSYDLNLNNDYYPNDNINNGAEISDNFVLVGATSYLINNKLKTESSNYGNIDVDLFAPGDYIFTTLPNNKYSNNVGGTSSASAITSGVAALIYYYYPNLKASLVKHILMDSGLEYKIEVNTPIEDNKNKTTPFNQLSKSGKVLNAYNALIMADSISKN